MLRMLKKRITQRFDSLGVEVSVAEDAAIVWTSETAR
jgi:hypothetical protein